MLHVLRSKRQPCYNEFLMYYYSPTHGKVDLATLREIVSRYMSEGSKENYQIIVGTDSQKIKSGNGYDFVSALVVHRLGRGGIYFWRRELYEKTVNLKERMYREALMSLEVSEGFVELLRSNGVSRFNIQIHIDIGKNGKTKDLIQEITGMIRSSGYDVKIKPDSFGASKVADRHT